MEWWECVKRNTWVLTVSHCSAKARAGREEFFGLQCSLQKLVMAENNGEVVDGEGMEAVIFQFMRISLLILRQPKVGPL